MRTIEIKKNDPHLLEITGRTGFFGGVLALRIRGNFSVIQNVKGHPKGSPILTFCQEELSEDDLYKIRQLYYKKYGQELETLKSVYNFAGAKENDGFFERSFESINKQHEIWDRNLEGTEKREGSHSGQACQNDRQAQPVHL